MKFTTKSSLSMALFCLASSGALSVLSAPVQAQEVPSQIVRYADLDISRSEGAKVLYDRIHAAAMRVCQKSVSSDGVLAYAAHMCVEKAIDDAVKHVNAPVLTALRFGGSRHLASK